MAIFYNLGACEVLPHHPGESVSYKKAISGFFCVVVATPKSRAPSCPIFSCFFDTFTSTLMIIKKKTCTYLN